MVNSSKPILGLSGFNNGSQGILLRSREIANKAGSIEVGTEHILAAATEIETPEKANLLRAGVSTETVMARITKRDPEQHKTIDEANILRTFSRQGTDAVVFAKIMADARDAAKVTEAHLLFSLTSPHGDTSYTSRRFFDEIKKINAAEKNKVPEFKLKLDHFSKDAQKIILGAIDSANQRRSVKISPEDILASAITSSTIVGKSFREFDSDIYSKVMMSKLRRYCRGEGHSNHTFSGTSLSSGIDSQGMGILNDALKIAISRSDIPPADFFTDKVISEVDLLQALIGTYGNAPRSQEILNEVIPRPRHARDVLNLARQAESRKAQINKPVRGEHRNHLEVPA